MPDARLVRIGVLDHGSGNLHSAVKALQAAGAEVTLGGVDDIRECDGVVVPGVGAFAACMQGLRQVGGDELVRERIASGRPVLGICVGHQVMFDEGAEHGIHSEGVGLLPGRVTRLDAHRLPHMGWNVVEPGEGSRLFTPGQRYYFVHSYGVLEAPDTPGAIVSWTEHEGVRVVAAVEAGPLTSFQFHPEKSGNAGVVLLRRWVESVRG